MHNKQSGFTLIELVMVIVILGILAAFALPKFADLTGDARRASINGLAGAIKSAAAIARAEQLASGFTLAAPVNLDGQNVDMVNGYPQAHADGIGAAAGIEAADYATATGTGGTGAATAITYRIDGYDQATCQVSYTSATNGTGGLNTAPIGASPTVVVVDTGC